MANPRYLQVDLTPVCREHDIIAKLLEIGGVKSSVPIAGHSRLLVELDQDITAVQKDRINDYLDETNGVEEFRYLRNPQERTSMSLDEWHQQRRQRDTAEDIIIPSVGGEIRNLRRGTFAGKQF